MARTRGASPMLWSDFESASDASCGIVNNKGVSEAPLYKEESQLKFKEWQTAAMAKKYLAKLCGVWKDHSGAIYDVNFSEAKDVLDVTKVRSGGASHTYYRIIGLQFRGANASIVWGKEMKRQYVLRECSDYNLWWCETRGPYSFAWKRHEGRCENERPREAERRCKKDRPYEEELHYEERRTSSSRGARSKKLVSQIGDSGKGRQSSWQPTLCRGSHQYTRREPECKPKDNDIQEQRRSTPNNFRESSRASKDNGKLKVGVQDWNQYARREPSCTRKDNDIREQRRCKLDDFQELHRTSKDNGMMKMGVIYWGDLQIQGKDTAEGWDITGRAPSGFPNINSATDELCYSWKGRMDNAHATLRMCASDRTGFKKNVQHFMMLSSRACMDFDLHAFHQHNTALKKKVLTERAVIGAIIEAFDGRISEESGVVVSNGAPDANVYIDYLRRRAQSYKEQAQRLGGLFVAVILESSGEPMRFVSAMANWQPNDKIMIKRILVVVGGPAGIKPEIREKLRITLEEHTDCPLIGVSLPGEVMHSYYALATFLVFHDQEALLPFLWSQMENQQSDMLEQVLSDGLVEALNPSGQSTCKPANGSTLPEEE